MSGNNSVATTIKIRRDTTANWAQYDPVLSLGEPGWDTDLNLLKFGDGVTVWTLLPAITGSGGGGGSQIQSDWNESNASLLDYIKNKPTSLSQFTNDLNLATVANTGSYNDLTNKPSLFSGSYTDLTNKPTIPDGTYANLTGKPTLFSGSYNDLTNTPALSNVATSGNYNDLTNTPVLANVAISGNYSDLNGTPSLSNVAISGSYNDLIDTPTIPNLTGYATEIYVNDAISNLISNAPGALNTLSELANALGNDANYSTTITSALSNKADKSSLANVATSGDYNDLNNKPIIPSISGLASTTYVDNKVANVTWANLSGAPVLSNVAISGSYNDLTGKPSLFSGSYTDLTNVPEFATVATTGSYNDLLDLPTITNYGDSNVEALLPNYTGNLSANNINASTEITVSGLGGDITLTGGNVNGANVITANTFVGTIDYSNISNTPNLSNIAFTATSDNSSVSPIDVMMYDGNAKYTSNVTITPSTGTITTTGDILPAVTDVQNLGNAVLQWANLFAGGSIYLGNLKLTVSNGSLEVVNVSNPGTNSETQNGQSYYVGPYNLSIDGGSGVTIYSSSDENFDGSTAGTLYGSADINIDGGGA